MNIHRALPSASVGPSAYSPKFHSVDPRFGEQPKAERRPGHLGFLGTAFFSALLALGANAITTWGAPLFSRPQEGIISSESDKTETETFKSADVTNSPKLFQQLSLPLRGKIPPNVLKVLSNVIPQYLTSGQYQDCDTIIVKDTEGNRYMVITKKDATHSNVTCILDETKGSVADTVIAIRKQQGGSILFLTFNPADAGKATVTLTRTLATYQPTHAETMISKTEEFSASKNDPDPDLMETLQKNFKNDIPLPIMKALATAIPKYLNNHEIGECDPIIVANSQSNKTCLVTQQSDPCPIDIEKGLDAIIQQAKEQGGRVVFLYFNPEDAEKPNIPITRKIFDFSRKPPSY